MTDYPHNAEIPFNVVGLDHVVILVDDMKKALDFYQGILGLPHGYSFPDLAMEQLWVGTELLVLIDTSNPKGAGAVPAVSGGRNMDHFCISLVPYDKHTLRTYLQANKVEIVNEAFHSGARGMGESVYVLDPFGTKIELKSPPVIDR